MADNSHDSLHRSAVKTENVFLETRIRKFCVITGSDSIVPTTGVFCFCCGLYEI